MRFRHGSAGGDVVAVTGTNTVSFALLTTPEVDDGLLGFAVQRTDPVANEKYFMTGYKVFASVLPNPPAGVAVSTYDQPVQSFVWDDFTTKPDQDYTYDFFPLKGRPKDLDRTTAPLTITVHTEALFTDAEHDVFFNRGVASSQAYARRFGSTPVDELDAATKAAAIDWLARDLDDALLKFIHAAQPGDQLLGCFYEFAYPPATDAFIDAIARGVDVQLIIDQKDNTQRFPLQENHQELTRSDFPAANWTPRTARVSDIAHNKFMVLIRDHRPLQVWTGSTNLTLSGLAGQTNVGHWVRNPDVAASYQRYWDLLRTDPGGKASDGNAQKRSENTAFEDAVQDLSPVPADLHDLPVGTTPIFSPRPVGTVLDEYVALLDQAKDLGCITLAFGIGANFKNLLADNTDHDALIFALLERKDQPNPRSTTEFITINAANNVYKAWGSYLQDPVYQWVRETNSGTLGLSTHVHYVHSKFMLIDPLGEDPIVVSGSANFSAASTTDNDENMIAIRGDRRAADIYFTEFDRLFNHYYFRSVTEARHHRRDADGFSLFLDETDGWQRRYAPGTLKRKRLRVYDEMFVPPASSDGDPLTHDASSAVR